ncbi:jg11936 [Pararge aegeria aegeria]|uniref:Jg11936 protein n=1 Tax=Pararge aegeria aegeria TaxID=348720 RepID=A0A8S4S6C1_9NEOP|nr:jg11936 [Pararge aegeria aegeria]
MNSASNSVYLLQFKREFSVFTVVSRRNDVSIERLVVQGKVEGTRARGRSPMRWTDQVKAAIEAQERQPLEKSGEGL